MTSDEATKWIGEWIGLSASMIRSGEDFTPTAEEVHKKARASLATLLSALTASQAEVERLGRERDEALALIGSDGADVAYQFGRAQAAEARATRAEEEIARRDAVAKASWGDQKDQHTDAIRAAHPTYTKDFETYEAALAMVGTRHGKYELVNLVNWLLARATRAEGLLAEAGEVSNRLLAWANRRCPCYDDSPSPCPLCGARVDATDENGVCKAAEYTVPGDLLRAARALLDKLKEQGQ